MGINRQVMKYGLSLLMGVILFSSAALAGKPEHEFSETINMVKAQSKIMRAQGIIVKFKNTDAEILKSGETEEDVLGRIGTRIGRHFVQKRHLVESNKDNNTIAMKVIIKKHKKNKSGD